jgi:arylformamidase
MTHDAQWHELQYNPRLTVKDAALITPAWRLRSMAVREKYPPMSDFKYGPHPRENLDLFRAPNAKGTLVYIHGGYWRMWSKLETSFVAEPFLAQGYSVVLINYPLCPDVTVHDIRGSIAQALKYLWQQLLTDTEKNNMVVSGHSAGGHLAAYLVTVDWAKRGLLENPIKAIVALSGVFDVAPLISTSMNVDIRLTAETAVALNLLNAAPHTKAKVLCAVGGHEPEEFHRQSKELVEVWSGLDAEYCSVAGTNHFSIVDQFADAGSDLHNRVLRLLRD